MTMENRTHIPMKDPDETECPLPDIYQKACKKIMHPDGWSCDDKCWRKIIAAMVSLGSRTFVVDPHVKEFDYSTLEPTHKTPIKARPSPGSTPKKNPFDDW